MKTIIIDLPPNLSAEGAAYAIATIANEIGCGAIAVTPPFHYNIDTSVGPVTVRSEAEPDNQAHPPLGTTLADFTAAMLDALPVGSAFGPGQTGEAGDVVMKRSDGWHYVNDGSWCVSFGEMYDQTRPIIRVGPEPKPTLASFAPEDIDKVCAEHRAYPTHEIVSKMLRERRESADVRRVGPEQASEPGPSAMLPDPEPVREPLPFPVRRYGSCRTWNQPDGEGRFDVGYEFFGCAAGPRDVSESRTFDTEAEGHAWLLSVMMDPGPLPDPWPDYRVEYDDPDADSIMRGTIRSVRLHHTGVTIYTHGGGCPRWLPDTIREVRTPDGTTVWKRPAAKVTTETEKVPEAYRHAPEDSYHWRKYHAPGSPDFFPVEDCRACRDLNAKVTT